MVVFTCSLNLDFLEKYKGCHTETQGVPVVTDRFLNMALTYLLRKLSAEVKEFFLQNYRVVYCKQAINKVNIFYKQDNHRVVGSSLNQSCQEGVKKAS